MRRNLGEASARRHQEKASGRRHLGEGIWEEASARTHQRGAIWEDSGRDFGKALGWVWEDSGRALGEALGALVALEALEAPGVSGMVSLHKGAPLRNGIEKFLFCVAFTKCF